MEPIECYGPGKKTKNVTNFVNVMILGICNDVHIVNLS